jgi:hypothetical protein
MALLHGLSVPSKRTRDSSSSLDADLNYPARKEFNGLKNEKLIPPKFSLHTFMVGMLQKFLDKRPETVLA